MAALSAGILLYRWRGGILQVLLIHPGGPFWRNKDEGAWMIPKGGVEEGEDSLACALREFEEEVGTRLDGSPWPLGRVRQSGGKWVEAFALEGNLDPDRIVSNHFQVEYPPKSGRFRSFPEVDQAGWFTMGEARSKMLRSQLPLLAALEERLSSSPA